MGFSMGKLLTLLLCFSLFEGWMVQSVPYDYSMSIECLPNPMKPLYSGGIIQNSEFNNGLAGWTAPWGVQASVKTSPSGNKFAATKGKSVQQQIKMETNHHYSLSAWLQVSGPAPVEVKATVRAPNSALIAAGATVVKPGCWTMFKGGMTTYSSGQGEVFFETDEPVEIWLDSVSMQPFTFKDWDVQRYHSAEKTRKTPVKVVARGGNGAPLANADVKVELVKRAFPFGNAMTKEILDIPAYEQWFTSRFDVATFENEMKWYSTEYSPGHEDYSIPDRMLALAQKHGIQVRGHNVFWDDPASQMKWVNALNADQLKAAMQKRLHSVVSRYNGKLIHWDVVNENVHFDFFEQKLGPDASPEIYRQVAQIDKTATLFMNDFGVIEQPMDLKVMPSKYVAMMRRIRDHPGNAGLKLAVGLESHFTVPNLPYVRACLDTFAQLKMPIWLTEVDVAKGPNQPKLLEEVLREGYGHPNVQGIVMWGAWHAGGCYVQCLTDNSFKNLPVGDAVDKLIAEWGWHPVAGKTDKNGAAQLGNLVHGQYKLTVTHPSLAKPIVHTSAVTPTAAAHHTINIDMKP